MNKKAKTALAIILALGIGSATWLYLARPSDDVWTEPAVRTVIEMMPDTTSEWAEVHKLTADGKKVESTVLYRNGERGIRYWRPNQTLAKEIIRFADGRDRKYAEFAADGKQIITGKEIRADGSTVWEAVLGEKNFVTTKTYWKNGTVFCVERRKVDQPKVDQWFYYPDGKQWEHYVGTHDPMQMPERVDIWREDGTMAFSHYLGLNESSYDATYRPDGTLQMRQIWVMRPTYTYSSTPAPQRRVLLKVEMYSDDGTRVTREFIMDSGGYFADRVIDRAEDGSYVESDLLYDGTVLSQTQYTTEGKAFSTRRFDSRTAFKISMPSEGMDSYADEYDPTQRWRDEEAGITP